MKNLTLCIFFIFGLLLQSSAQSRTVEQVFGINDNDKIQLDLRFGDLITVKSWDKEHVSFRAIIEINNGKLNDALIFDFKHEPGKLEIGADFDEQRTRKGRREDCPDSRYAGHMWNSDGEGSFICSNIQYEIFVPENSDISLESISADIELMGLTGPIRAKSISGFVDLSWPKGNSADVDIKTVSGEAFTNIDEVQFENRKDHIPLVGYKLKGKIGSGGRKVSLESVSGNIYLRKAQS